MYPKFWESSGASKVQAECNQVTADLQDDACFQKPLTVVLFVIAAKSVQHSPKRAFSLSK